MTAGRSAGRGSLDHGHWTVGVDEVGCRPAADEAPTTRLHAVGADGLIAGRALCLAPVTLLDPALWTWPDDGDEEWPLCWVCLALTC
ncbi:hypothetical protein ACI789_03470 [Geodermatophilus sp. SYSU D00965]